MPTRKHFTVTQKWEYALEEDIFVKKDGKWYLIGQKVIQWHGG